MRLDDLKIGINFPAFVAAEISGNHGGSLSYALDLIGLASASGAQGVKFQTYTADTLSIDSNKQYFQLPSNSPWKDSENHYQLYKKAHTPWEWLPKLFEHSRKLNIIPFSSPFDESAVEFLEQLDCPMYKVASPEINHVPLLRRLAKTNKPIILSLGVASESDVSLAVEEIRKISKSEIVILQCETKYPAEPYRANLKLLWRLEKDYDCVVGISDHTIGSELVDVAIGAGSKFFEKHIKLAGKSTVDDFFSADPDEFKKYVWRIRNAESMLGEAIFRHQKDDEFRRSNSRSIFACQDINKGHIFTESNVKIVRPGYGLEPIRLYDLIGKFANRDIERGEPITEFDFHE